jgi:hypothetical protein
VAVSRAVGLSANVIMLPLASDRDPPKGFRDHNSPGCRLGVGHLPERQAVVTLDG